MNSPKKQKTTKDTKKQSIKKTEISIESIPIPLIQHIFRYTDPGSWLSIFLTCKSWNEQAYKSFDLTINDNWPLRHAAREGHLTQLNRLLECPGVDVTARNNEALSMAVIWNNLPILDRLLQCSDLNPTENRTFALKIAATGGYLSIANRLLECPEIYSTTQLNNAIYVAQEEEHWEVRDRLVEYGFKIWLQSQKEINWNKLEKRVNPLSWWIDCHTNFELL